MSKHHTNTHNGQTIFPGKAQTAPNTELNQLPNFLHTAEHQDQASNQSQSNLSVNWPSNKHTETDGQIETSDPTPMDPPTGICDHQIMDPHTS